MAKVALADEKVQVLQGDQFEEVEWPLLHKALNDVPRMIQVWACKQVCGVAGTNEMQARYTPNHSKKCPSCYTCVETCSHVLDCEEEGRVDLLHQCTDPMLQKVLIEYAHGRGGKTMSKIVGGKTGKCDSRKLKSRLNNNF